MCLPNIGDGVYMADGFAVFIVFAVVVALCILFGGTFWSCEKTKGCGSGSCVKDNLSMSSHTYNRFCQPSEEHSMHISIDTVDVK